MKQCAAIQATRAAFVALELPMAREEEVREHLRGCGACLAHYLNAEPALVFSLRMPDGGVGRDDEEEFVQGVLTGVRQRRVEQRLGRWRSWWRVGAAAAVLVVAVLGSGRLFMATEERPELTVADHQPAHRVDPVEPLFIEVEGKGVRLYQLTTGGERPVPVAFVVDPSVEL